MSTSVTGSVSTERPISVTLAMGLLVFLGITAVAGSIGMLSGNATFAPPLDWLDGVPIIDSWLIPGLVLGIVFGLGSLVAAFGLLRRPLWDWVVPIERVTHHHWSWIATILLGLGQTVWIILELVYLPDPSALQAVYLPVGIALAVLPLTTASRTYLGRAPGRRPDPLG